MIFPPEPSKECVKVSHVIFECRVINHQYHPKVILHTTLLILNLVYKIPYRRARAWPSGCIGRVRRASKGILHTILNLYTRYPIVARALGLVRRVSKGILHTILNLTLIQFKWPYEKTIISPLHHVGEIQNHRSKLRLLPQGGP